jgi:hypothetical protein
MNAVGQASSIERRMLNDWNDDSSQQLETGFLAFGGLRSRHTHLDRGKNGDAADGSGSEGSGSEGSGLVGVKNSNGEGDGYEGSGAEGSGLKGLVLEGSGGFIYVEFFEGSGYDLGDSGSGGGEPSEGEQFTTTAAVSASGGLSEAEQPTLAIAASGSGDLPTATAAPGGELELPPEPIIVAAPGSPELFDSATPEYVEPLTYDGASYPYFPSGPQPAEPPILLDTDGETVPHVVYPVGYFVDGNTVAILGQPLAANNPI